MQLVPFFLESPFRTISQIFQPEFEVFSFDELLEIKIREKKGTSCIRLVAMRCVDFFGCDDFFVQYLQ